MEEKYKSPNEDFEIIDFGDKRLNKRLVKSTRERMQGIKTRSSGKGFYRLLSNEKFTYEKIEKSCQEGTIERMKGHCKVLLVQDTSDINLSGHEKTKGLGYSRSRSKGIELHSCLAVSVCGLPLGVLGQSYESRATAETSSLNEWEKAKRPIEEKSSYRWIEMMKKTLKLLPEGVEGITVCDRESDIFEMYEEAYELESSFVIRAAYDRKTETEEKLFAKIRKSPAIGYATIEIPRDTRKNRKARQATMAVSSCSIRISKKKNSLPVSAVRIAEISECDEPVEWILLTNLPVDSPQSVMEIVQYYVHRWKIERFHYVLKSGCNVEGIQQRSFKRMLPVILICSMIANFILAMTCLGRSMPELPCDLFFEEDEWKLLYRFAKRTKFPPVQPYSLSDAIKMLGELGIGKRAPSDGHFGVKSVWLGLKAFYSAADLLMGQV